VYPSAVRTVPGRSVKSTVSQTPSPCDVTSSKTSWGTDRWNIVMPSNAYTATRTG
jgi:hypothetical protein